MTHPSGRGSRGGARRQQLPSIRVVTTAAERLHGSSMTVTQMSGLQAVASTRVQIYAVSGER